MPSHRYRCVAPNPVHVPDVGLFDVRPGQEVETAQPINNPHFVPIDAPKAAKGKPHTTSAAAPEENA